MDKKNKKVFTQPHDDFQRELEEIYNKIKGVKDVRHNEKNR